MRKCRRCGKKGLFIKLNATSLCSECVRKDDEEIERRQRQERYAAESYIHEMSRHIKPVFEHTTILPHWGQERIREIHKHCEYILDHIDEWKTFRRFNEAFKNTLIQEKYFKTSPLFPFTYFSDHSPPNYEELFDQLYRKVSDISISCWRAADKAYDYSKVYTVVGVTFKNGRKSRQTLLRKLRFGDAPFDGYVELELEKYDFEGEDAVGVFANGEQLGNISRHDLPWLLEHWDEYHCVSEYDVRGGGDYSYGIDIRVCFRNK